MPEYLYLPHSSKIMQRRPLRGWTIIYLTQPLAADLSVVMERSSICTAEAGSQ